MIKGTELIVNKVTVQSESNNLNEYLLTLKASKNTINKIIDNKEDRKVLKKLGNMVTGTLIEYMCKENAEKVLNNFILCGVKFSISDFFKGGAELVKEYEDVEFDNMPEEVQRLFDVILVFRDLDSAEKASRIISENSY